MRLTSEWRRQILDKWGIRTLTAAQDSPRGSLWVSRCTSTKRVKRGTPRELYGSPLLTFFLARVEAADLPHAVLSDRHGLHFADESLAWYDVHPSSLSAAEKSRLGRRIREKALKRGFRDLVFYNGSPVRSVPYFEMLAASQLTIWYTTQMSHVGTQPQAQSRA